MSFTVTTEVANGIARITLDGELDASSAPDFKAAIEKVAADKPRRLVLMLSGLEYMASAGLRVLIFAKQKLGAATDIFVVGAPAGDCRYAGNDRVSAQRGHAARVRCGADRRLSRWTG